LTELPGEKPEETAETRATHSLRAYQPGDRPACRDCHANETVWPTSWYTQIAPSSWVIANGGAEGRSVLNFSERATYSPAQQTLLAASCQTAMDGTLPGSAWTLLRPEARLSVQDIETLCIAARQAR
jgi:hypothetical protein